MSIYDKLKEQPLRLHTRDEIAQLVQELDNLSENHLIDREMYHVLHTNLTFFSREYIKALMSEIVELEAALERCEDLQGTL